MNNTNFKHQLPGIINYTVLIAFILIGSFPGTAKAQDAYKLVSAHIKVNGTSNLHNWSMETKDIAGHARFDFAPGNNDQPQLLPALDLTLSVKSIKSGESLMDSRAYDALKADKFQSVSYVLTSAVIVPLQKRQFLVKSSGNLTISGTTKPIAMDVSCTINPDGSIACSGSHKISMTDFGIKPPSFMFGALKTGNELTVDFSLVYNK